MEIKEMPLEEKYEKTLDQYILNDAINFAFQKEHGLLDEYYDFHLKVQKKMIPGILGKAFKVFKAVAPGRAFKRLVNEFVYVIQSDFPLSNIELTIVSDREATLRINNCPKLKRTRELVKKAGLNINSVAMCAREAINFREYGKMFGIDMKVQFEKGGCITTARLK